MGLSESLIRDIELAEELFGLAELEEYAEKWREENKKE